MQVHMDKQIEARRLHKDAKPGAAPYVPKGGGRPAPKAKANSADAKKPKDLEARYKKTKARVAKATESKRRDKHGA